MKSPTIVVGSDLEGTSDSALDYALRLRPRLDARVVLVHVVERSAVPRGNAADKVRKQIAAFKKVVDWQIASAEQLLARQLRRVDAAKSPVALEVRSGKPSVELLTAVQKREAILLVLGMSEHEGGPGHVIQRVLAATGIPVLIIPSTYFDSSAQRAVVRPLASRARTRPRLRSVKRASSGGTA